MAGCCEHGYESSGFVKCGELVDSGNVSFSRRTLIVGLNTVVTGYVMLEAILVSVFVAWHTNSTNKPVLLASHATNQQKPVKYTDRLLRK